MGNIPNFLPYHEALIKVIKETPYTPDLMGSMPNLIKVAKIPPEHIDEVINVWKQKMNNAEMESDQGVLEYLLLQRKGYVGIHGICIISQDDFRKLQRGYEIKDKDGKVWAVSIADCGGQGKYPMHYMCNGFGKWYYLYHDGTNIRISIFMGKDDPLDGSICDAFEKPMQ
ncbi:MAG: hypothetical protein WDK96_03030 [Candidatus Paceibacterota bacterium]|jgi:hypothetical protein